MFIFIHEVHLRLFIQLADIAIICFTITVSKVPEQRRCGQCEQSYSTLVSASLLLRLGGCRVKRATMLGLLIHSAFFVRKAFSLHSEWRNFMR